MSTRKKFVILFSAYVVVLLGFVFVCFKGQVTIKSFLLRNLSSVYEPYLQRQCMPYVKKYLDRPAYREQLYEEELTIFVNDILLKNRIMDKKAVVLIAKDNDIAFAEARVAFVADLIDSYFILVQREFYDNYPREVVHAVLCHEIGHIVANDNLMRLCIYEETIIPIQIFVVVLGLLSATLLGFAKAQIASVGLLFFCAGNVAYSIAFSSWVQRQELAADSFAVKICGLTAVTRMLYAFADLSPEGEGRMFSIWQRLFAAHPSYERRIFAVNKLA